MRRRVALTVPFRGRLCNGTGGNSQDRAAACRRDAGGTFRGGRSALCDGAKLYRPGAVSQVGALLPAGRWAARWRWWQAIWAKPGCGSSCGTAIGPTGCSISYGTSSTTNAMSQIPKGSRHNRGAAVDLTLVDAQGQELVMPTPFDDFGEKAHRSYQQLPPLRSKTAPRWNKRWQRPALSACRRSGGTLTLRAGKAIRSTTSHLTCWPSRRKNAQP